MTAESPSAWITVTINGEPHRIPAASRLTDLITTRGLDGERVAIAINRSVIRRPDYPTQRLVHGDTIDIVHAVGGG